MYHATKVLYFKITRTLDKIEEANEELDGKEKLTRLQMTKKLLTANEAEIQKLLKELEMLIGDDEDDDQDGENQNTMALQLAIRQLQPKIEPHLLKHGMKWDDALPALELIDSVEEIAAAIED